MKDNLIEAFELYEKMVECKAEQKEEDKSLKQRFYLGLFLFFAVYSILLTVSLVSDLIG